MNGCKNKNLLNKEIHVNNAWDETLKANNFACKSPNISQECTTADPRWLSIIADIAILQQISSILQYSCRVYVDLWGKANRMQKCYKSVICGGMYGWKFWRFIQITEYNAQHRVA